MKKNYELKIDEAVQKLHYVGEDNVIQIYADYRDNAEFLLETIYDNRSSKELESLVQDEIYEAYADVVLEYEGEILKAAGLVGTEFEDEALEYLRNTYSIDPPYEHFLSDDMKVNIMLATDEERNRDCCGIHEQYLAMEDPGNVWNAQETLAEKTGLSWLLEQQGHSMAELQATLKDYNFFFYDDAGYYKSRAAAKEKVSLSGVLDEFNKTHNPFLTSVCQELENHTYNMGVMTVLAKMTVKEFIEMQSGQKEVTMPKNCDIGIFNPWNGSGSCLEIELEKPLVFSSDLIRDVQIEGVKPQWEYTVDDTYGLIGSCWKEPVSIKEAEKPSLDDVIKSCAAQVVERDSGKGAVARDL